MYTFPFNTCETPKKGIAQPYSAMLNAINCVMISYFLVQTKSFFSTFLLFSIFCFELFHTFSHSIHIPGKIQTTISHFLSYAINFAFLFFFIHLTNKVPSFAFLFYLLLLTLFDIYSLFYLSIVFYLISQAILMISLLTYYFPLLSNSIQTNIYKIIALTSMAILLFLNETYNCKKMLDIYPLPYHSLIEIVGILLFYVICSTFYKF
jgi:hypothetical protein